MLRFRIRIRPRKMSSAEGLGSGPEGRLKRLRKNVTALIRHERIEALYPICDETRGYAEKLISMAVRNGDTDKHTMEMADYWLLEKDLIHKLFKVLVPRYQSLPVAATSIHRISGIYPGDGHQAGVLELKGNPWPSVRPQPRNTHLHLHNIQLAEAKKEYHVAKPQGILSATSSFTPPSADETLMTEGSSVDVPSTGSGEPFEDLSHAAVEQVQKDSHSDKKVS